MRQAGAGARPGGRRGGAGSSSRTGAEQCHHGGEPRASGRAAAVETGEPSEGTSGEMRSVGSGRKQTSCD
jgi:hypothetical protein